MIALYLGLVVIGSAAIALAVRGARGFNMPWPVRIATADGEIIVHHDGTVEWQSGTRSQALRVVRPTYWEEAI